MKKVFSIIIIIALTVIVFGCSKKMAPAKTETPSTPPVVVVAAPVDETPKIVAAGNAVAGKDIYNTKCGRCHGLKEPSVYTPQRWVGLVDWMAPKAGLNNAEKNDVLAYVQANAKKS